MTTADDLRIKVLVGLHGLGALDASTAVGADVIPDADNMVLGSLLFLNEIAYVRENGRETYYLTPEGQEVARQQASEEGV